MGVDQIGTKGLVDCSVAAADIAPGTITSAKLAGSIANAKLSNSSITVNGQSISLGASGAVPPVQWQSVVVSDGSTVTTMVAGRGYFVNNTSAAGLVKLPASAATGDLISIKDYAGNFNTNKLTIQRNGHNIQGIAANSELTTNRASVSLVYIDSTKGWLFTNESNVQDLGPFMAATGGTITTSGNYKVHTFTGDGNFVVSQVGTSDVKKQVSYVVIAGGAGGGSGRGGGGGAGGYREGKQTCGGYTASPVAAAAGLTMTATTFPVTVGAGGGINGPNSERGENGNNSVFSTITSAAGGYGGGSCNRPGGPGGSGGGGGANSNPGGCGGAGNTPPVSPSQGNAGGDGYKPGGQESGGGGGGIAGAGTDGSGPGVGGPGGNGVASEITGSSVTRGGGGGGGGGYPSTPSAVRGTGGSGGGGNGAQNPASGTGLDPTAGTANTGGGGGGGTHTNAPACQELGKSGGSGVVIIRYKFQ
jgi:hypothetical protein